jgi:hypothetical protein
MDFVQKFLLDNAQLLVILVVLNAVLSGLAVVLEKLMNSSIALKFPVIRKAAVIIRKAADFLSANVPHEKAPELPKQ